MIPRIFKFRNIENVIRGIFFVSTLLIALSYLFNQSAIFQSFAWTYPLNLFLYFLGKIYFLLIILSLLSARYLISKSKYKKLVSPKINQKVFLISLIIIVALGSFIRLYKLGDINLANDEGLTSLYAQHIADTGIPCWAADKVCYRRGFPYTYFVAGFVKLFGFSEFIVRLPSVFMYMLTLCFFYLILSILSASRRLIFASFIIISLADFNVALSGLARMYSMSLVFVLMFSYFYLREFIAEKRHWSNYFAMFFAFTLGIYTHIFAIVLLYFLLDPLLRRKFYIYKDIRVITLFLSMISIFFLRLDLTWRIYLDPNYLGPIELLWAPLSSATDRFISFLTHFWKIFDSKLFTHLFVSLPLLALSWIVGIFSLWKKKHYKTLIIFVIICFLLTSWYGAGLYPRHTWVVFTLFSLFSAYGILILFKLQLRWTARTIITFLALGNMWNIFYLKGLSYWDTTTKVPLLQTVIEEDYIRDDSFFISFLDRHYSSWDIILVDYWIQEIYLQLHNYPFPDYLISWFTPKEHLANNSYNKIYHENYDESEDENNSEVWRYYKDGPEFVYTIEQLEDLVKKHEGKNIYYISSANFNYDNRHPISNETVYQYIEKEYRIIVRGRDGYAKIFRIQ